MQTHHTKATIDANGSLHIDALPFSAGQTVDVIVSSSVNGGIVDEADRPEKSTRENSIVDPLAGIRVSTGISDLAEHFDDYRFGTPRP